ncbi:hypothetical protein IFM89_030887, partial [Coptis chinensis]
MDTHYSPGRSNSLDDDQLNEDMGDDSTNIPGSSVSASSKKRGPSIGIEEIKGQPRPELVMQNNRKGQPVTPIDVVSEFGTRLGYIARRDIPTIDTDYTRQKLNEAWRNYKHTLYETFVEDEDPSLVKEVTLRNIPLEDWHKFVDYCNTDKFKAMSARNKLNREQQIMPSSLGRTSVAIARNELALEKGILESEITRADSYMLIHKPKEIVPQSQEVLNLIKNHISEHLESQYDLSGDAIATNDGLMEANTLLERRMETMEANMDAKMSRHMEEVRGMFMSQRGTFNRQCSIATFSCQSSSLRSDVALECIMGYIDDARDRDVVSLVCRDGGMRLIKLTRKHVTIAFCYTTMPRCLRQRFPRLESLKLKGKTRASMFNLIPKDWGGFSDRGLGRLAEGFNCLKCLHFRRMIVMDEDLEILSRSWSMLHHLNRINVMVFLLDGLLHVTCSCRFLRTRPYESASNGFECESASNGF